MAKSFSWANMPTDILRTILCMTVKAMENDREESVDRLLDDDFDSNGEDQHNRSSSDEVIVAPDYSVNFLLSCASVSKHWADVIRDETFWLSLPYDDFLRLLPDPWEYPRWRGFFQDKSVLLSCLPSKLVETFGKVHLSKKCGHSRFTVVLPFTMDARIHNFEAWERVKNDIIDTCKHLTFDALIINQVDEDKREDEEGQSRKEDDDEEDLQHGRYYSAERSMRAGLGGSSSVSLQRSEWCLLPGTWHKLETLNLAGRADGSEFQNSFCPGHIWPRCVRTQLRENEQGHRNNPSFPTLKYLRLCDHPYGHFSREMINAAPNLERCEIITAGYRKGPIQGWDMHRNSIAHRKFLDGDLKFRTYVTPYFMRAFKHPGPKKFGNRYEFLSLDQVSHTPGYGVLVSERRNGTLCEVWMGIDEFFEVDDLQNLYIPESNDNSSI